MSGTERDTSEQTTTEATTEAATETSSSLPADPPQWDTARATPDQIEQGLRFSHFFHVSNQRKADDALATVNALAELLIAKGHIHLSEVSKRREMVKQHMDQEDSGPSVWLSNEDDKYAAKPTMIDCANRLHICKARCCAFTFALSTQDLDEGIVKFEYGRPYRIRQAEDGWCVHLDRQTRGCTVHKYRPHVCRTYDCRNDKRVWADFDKMIPSPDIARENEAAKKG